MTEKKEIILAIDDEEPVRELISDTLSSGNYTVLSSENAGGALELLAMNCELALPPRPSGFSARTCARSRSGRFLLYL